LLTKFKEGSYIDDFMGEEAIVKAKENPSKINKKIKKSVYCFNLLVAITLVSLFYLVQICFSSLMLIVVNTNINEVLWVVKKQSMISKLILNQIVTKNMVM
jgi:hypothetical protein